jgi:hypothetical protein
MSNKYFKFLIIGGILIFILLAFLVHIQIADAATVPYRIRMASSTYTAQLRGVTGTRTAGLIVAGTYSSTFKAHEFDLTVDGHYDLWFDAAGGSNYVKDAAWSGANGKYVGSNYYSEQIDTDQDYKVDQIDDNAVGITNLTTAALNYIGAGGAVTNLVDDSTTATNPDSTIYVKDEFLDNTEVGRQGFSSYSVNLREHVENLNMVNVIDFGAIPNDGLDDSQGFQDALDTNYPVYVPGGEYLIADVEINQYGQALIGQKNTYTNSYGALLKPASNKCTMIKFTGAATRRASVQGFEFYGQTATDTAKYGIYVEQGADDFIRDCQFNWFTFGTGITDWNVIPYADTSYAVYVEGSFDFHQYNIRYWRNDIHNYYGGGGTQVGSWFNVQMYQAIICHIWINGGSTFGFYHGNIESGAIYAGYDSFVRLENVFSFEMHTWSAETGNAYQAWDSSDPPGSSDSLNIGWMKIVHTGNWAQIPGDDSVYVTLDSAMTSKSGNDTIKVADDAETATFFGIGDTIRIGAEKMVLFRYPSANNFYWYVKRVGTSATHSIGDTLWYYTPSTSNRTNVKFSGGGISGGSYHSIHRAHFPAGIDLSGSKGEVSLNFESMWFSEILNELVDFPDEWGYAKKVNVTIKNSYVRDILNGYAYIDHLQSIGSFADMPDTLSWYEGITGGQLANQIKYGNPLVLEKRDTYNHTPMAHLTFYQDDDALYFEPYDNKYSLKFSNPHPGTGTTTDYDIAYVASNASDLVTSHMNWAADSSRTFIVWYKPQRITGGGASSRNKYVTLPENGVLVAPGGGGGTRLMGNNSSVEYLNTNLLDDVRNATFQAIHYYGEALASNQTQIIPRDNEWSMLAWVRDASSDNSPNGRLVGYVDGLFHYERDMPKDEAFPSIGSNLYFLRYLDGQVDDFAVYKTVLTGAQIDSIYNRGKCPDLETYPTSAAPYLTDWVDFEKSNYGAGSGATEDTVFSVTDADSVYILLGSTADNKPQLVKDSPTYTSFIEGYTATDDNREGDDVKFSVDKDGYVDAPRYYLSDDVYILWSDSVYVINEAVPDTFVMRTKK